MNLVLIKVSSFLSIIIAGMLAGRTGKLGRRTGEAISKIVFNFTLPAAIVHAFGSANFTPDMLLLVPLGLICALCPYLITYVVTRHSSHDDRILYLMNISGFNIGSFGLPFVQAFFPASTVVAACMFDAGNALMMTGGTYAVTRVLTSGNHINHPIQTIIRRLLSSIPFDSYLVLISMAIVGLRVPQAIVAFTEPMANANGFLSMFMPLLSFCHLAREFATSSPSFYGRRWARWGRYSPFGNTAIMALLAWQTQSVFFSASLR